jgi:type IX secretion system PorP/SprF family membrane protein
MRKFILSIIAIISLSFVYGQQEAQYSNYIMNNFMINPAVAGSYSYWSAKAGYRAQWLGVDGGPRTFFTTVHGQIKPKKKGLGARRAKKEGVQHGIGFNAYSDNVGAMSYSGFSGTYAAHIKLDRTWTLSLGASVGVKEFRLNANNLEFEQDVIDPTISGGIFSEIKPDVNVGAWLYSKNAFVGVSARQILQSDINVGFEVEENDFSKLYNHYYLTGGIKFVANQDWSIVPSIMIQAVRPAPIQVDLNTTFWYQDKIGLGISYRHLDAIYAVFEYVHNQKFEFSYAYDLTVSELNRYSKGSHEVIVGVRWGSKGRVTCPSKFW